MRKKQFTVKLLMTALVTAILFIGLTACKVVKESDWKGDSVEGSGQLIEESRSVGFFNSVRLSGSGKVIVTGGPGASVRLMAEDNIMPLIETRVEGDTLVVETNRPYRTNIGITVYLTMSEIKGFTLSGAWVLSSESELTVDDLDIEVSGAGRIDLDVRAGNIFTSLSGAGEIILRGSADRHRVRISGAGNLNAEGLEVRYYDIQVSGAGNCRIFVTEELVASISGTGSIYYRGNPAIVESNISGTGKLVKL
jgi:hypothetical protein